MKQFFKDFLKRHRVRIFAFSALRIIDFLQCLFAPYVLAKIINIVTQNSGDWQKASFWTIILIVNETTEDIVRLRGKLGLEKIAIRFKLALATFFSEETEIRKNKKTGQAVQAIRKAGDVIQGLVNFYKDNLLQLPVNFIIIPLVLWSANIDYLFLLIIYIVLYFSIECFMAPIHNKKLQKFFRASETFWGTTYRKTPEVWRQREDGQDFIQQMDKQAEALYKSDVNAVKINNWRWIFLQCLSSVTIGLAILFVLYKIFNNNAPIGDLILVSSYFATTQETLNIITSTITRFLHTKISLKRLDQAVKIR